VILSRLQYGPIKVSYYLFCAQYQFLALFTSSAVTALFLFHFRLLFLNNFIRLSVHLCLSATVVNVSSHNSIVYGFPSHTCTDMADEMIESICRSSVQAVMDGPGNGSFVYVTNSPGEREKKM
jgi:hypothetical protein